MPHINTFSTVALDTLLLKKHIVLMANTVSY